MTPTDKSFKHNKNLNIFEKLVRDGAVSSFKVHDAQLTQNI